MIEQFAIFSRGGTVLWSKEFSAVTGSPLDKLVRSVLVENRAGGATFDYAKYMIQWAFANEHGLVFVVLSLKQFRAAYATELLERVKVEFLHRYGEAVKSGEFDEVDDSSFASIFKRIHLETESASKTRPRVSSTKFAAKAKTGSETVTATRETTVTKPGELQSVEPRELDLKLGDATSTPRDIQDAEEDTNALSAEDIRKRLKKKYKKPKEAVPEAPIASNRGKKVMRESMGSKSTAHLQAKFDCSETTEAGDGQQYREEEVQRIRDQFLNAPANNYQLFLSDDENEGEETTDLTSGAARPVKESRMLSFFKGISGQKELTRKDLAPALEKFMEQLVEKNVAIDIANQLCDSVGASLEGKIPGSFNTVSRMVRNAMHEALTQLLTPKQSTDILNHAKSVKEREKRPFVIVFCGVNGVGKSTSLAKRHGLSVHLAACDTFRSGAVEQLRTHAVCLEATLHEQGYNKDAASVAKFAIANAKKAGADVMLVDTAGRMQDNEPLMRALAKLVAVNEPDRVFFVGEALVGNDGVDQLTKFDRALVDHSPSDRPPRRIDGIVLTKFDTIDDKVGAAVSMVYSTGQPIVFVGVGQTYMDLRKVNTSALVKALLS